jgi:hypothetical protein
VVAQKRSDRPVRHLAPLAPGHVAPPVARLLEHPLRVERATRPQAVTPAPRMAGPTPKRLPQGDPRTGEDGHLAARGLLAADGLGIPSGDEQMPQHPQQDKGQVEQAAGELLDDEGCGRRDKPISKKGK